jgi:hypothetical protein
MGHSPKRQRVTVASLFSQESAMSRALSLAACLLFLFVPLAAALGQELPQPGPEHEMLKQNEGTWTAVIKMSDGTESQGEMTSKMECGGFWLVTNFEGDFGGLKFQGKGMDGYDTQKKKFVSVWVDSMTTAPMMLDGTYDEKAKTLTMKGEAQGPDGKPTKHRLVTKYKDRDHQTFEMFMNGPGGDETSMMTIEYTRKK